ncbi:hypothetical protein [Aurantibacillus circumpalustris]|uniref:hypothetical protein n=1 Tax=Aurantibacillus circumpalustris TaxID=3036359 RepID=UPI00295AC234|nr:hypothetical protein [Aurantibacillus circumpalustris]
MRNIVLFLFLSIFFIQVSAQKDSSTYLPTKKKAYKYIGIQSNLLLQQFISFNSNSSINSNPYTLCFSSSNVTTGSGMAFATGFNVSENSSNDGVSSLHLNTVNVTIRAGYEKKYLQHQRFIPFWGIEFGMGVVYSKLTSFLNQSFNTTSTTVETTKFFAGPSIRGGLNYALSKHILLGTEFFINSQISSTQTSDGNGNGGGSNFVPFNIGVQAPTALFLIFRY